MGLGLGFLYKDGPSIVQSTAKRLGSQREAALLRRKDWRGKHAPTTSGQVAREAQVHPTFDREPDLRS